MLRHKNIDRLCCMVMACTLLLTCLYMGAAAGGLLEGANAMGYETRLFDQSRVHTIDIVIDDWDGFLKTCTDEEYVSCTAIIDSEAYADVGIRAKGNTSLSSVSSYGNNRYSFKIEFDQYQTGRTYYGLDKLSLNNLIQDKTLLKDYLAYTLMNKMGAAAPLCSFVQINVNGEAWGLYLAVEAIEDGFLERNYGSRHGELYKPDSMSFGGGRGNGKNFDMDTFSEQFAEQLEQLSQMDESERTDFFKQFSSGEGFPFPGGFMSPAAGDGASAKDAAPSLQPSASPDALAALPSAPTQNPEEEGISRSNAAAGRMGSGISERNSNKGFRGDFGGMNMGSSDVLLQYIDDNPSSYSNIFSSAKTDVTEEDQLRLIQSLKILSEGANIESAVDTDAVIRYLVVHNFMCNDDSYTGNMIHNYYLYEENGLLSMLPWDYNLSFGAFSMGSSGDAADTVNSPIDSPVSSGDISDRPIISWIFENEAYTARYHELYAEFISLIYDSGWLDQEIARVSEMIAPYVRQDPTAFFTYEQFTTAVQTLREFCSLRCASIAGQLDGVVPSTDDAQRTHSASLIDASHLSLSDMGEFGMGGGRGGMNFPDSRTMPDDMTLPGNMTIPNDRTLPDNMTIPDDMTLPDNMTIPDGITLPGNMTIPDGMNRQQDKNAAPDGFNSIPSLSNTDASADHRAYLTLCAALLTAAVIIVRFVKSGR